MVTWLKRAIEWLMTQLGGTWSAFWIALSSTLVALGTATIDAISTVVGGASDVISSLVVTGIGTIFGAFAAAFNWGWSYLLSWGVVPDIGGIVDAFRVIVPYLQDADWILPMSEVVGIVFAAFVAVGAIRFGRWVLSFFWITG